MEGAERSGGGAESRGKEEEVSNWADQVLEGLLGVASAEGSEVDRSSVRFAVAISASMGGAVVGELPGGLWLPLASGDRCRVSVERASGWGELGKRSPVELTGGELAAALGVTCSVVSEIATEVSEEPSLACSGNWDSPIRWGEKGWLELGSMGVCWLAGEDSPTISDRCKTSRDRSEAVEGD